MGEIEGARVIPLKVVAGERGHLMEVQRADDACHPGFGQAYVTCTLPGVVKAWYRHRKQFDQVALVKGELRLALYDAREGSATRHNLLEVVITEERPALVQIPPGVWHGFRAEGREPAYLLHLNSAAYNFEETDEEQLPPDSDSIPYGWPAG